MKVNGQEAVEVTVYVLGKRDEILPGGKRTLPIRVVDNYEQDGASSRLKRVRLRCVEVGGHLYLIEKEAGRPAIFLPNGVKLPPVATVNAKARTPRGKTRAK